MNKIKEFFTNLFYKIKNGFVVYYFIYFALSFIFSEFILKWQCSKSLPITAYTAMFSASLALIPSVFIAIFSRKGRIISSAVISFVSFAIFGTQLIYFDIYDSYLSVSQIGMGADAIGSFIGTLLIHLKAKMFILLLLLIPFIALWANVILTSRKNKSKHSKPHTRISLKGIAASVILFLIIHFATVLCLPLSGTQTYSPYDVYHNTFILAKSENFFGVLTSLRLELKAIIFGDGSSFEVIVPVVLPDDEGTDTEDDEKEENPDDKDDKGEKEKQDDPVQKDPEPVDYGKNVSDADFAALAQNEKDERLKVLDQYFASQEATGKNEYTGLCRDFNLIVLCCESYSKYIIDEERTPMLWKMSHEGVVCNNYYGTVCDNTSNGEYALMIGLLPDTSLLGKGWNTFYNYNSFTASKKNHLPFCFANQLKKLGYNTTAAHYYKGTYYGRNETHPNMGYDKFLWKGKGLEKTDDCPTSDLSMVKQTLPAMLEKDENGNITPFHLYYLTFSGHMPYNFSTVKSSTSFSNNDMTLKNKEVVEGLAYSTAVRAYIACQMEVEYALEYIYETLEDAGQLDRTIIVLTADHYPYSLGLNKLEELAGRDLDNEFGKYEGGLILWTSAFKNPVTVDEPCCTLDILPTVSNLLGLDFDSRLLMGTDILSDGNHVAILADRSFINNRIIYNCTNGEVTLRKSDDVLPDGYVDAWVNYVKNKFTVSTEILYTDYYRKIADHLTYNKN